MLRIEFRTRQWKNDAFELEMRESIRDMIKKDGAAFIHEIRNCLARDEAKLRKTYTQICGVIFFAVVFMAILITSFITGHIVVSIVSLLPIYLLCVRFSDLKFEFTIVKFGLDTSRMALEEYEKMRM